LKAGGCQWASGSKAFHEHDIRARALVSAPDDRLILRRPKPSLQIVHRGEFDDDEPRGLPGPFGDFGGAATDKETSAELRQRPGRMASIGLVNVSRVDFDIRDAVGGHGLSVQLPARIRAVAIGAEMPPRHDGDAASFSYGAVVADSATRESSRSRP